MRHTIQNDFVSLEIAELGAEMKSLKSIPNEKEWLWQADPDFWPRTAPVLFPIVGKLVEDQFFHNEHPYPLSQHGFARDRVFDVIESGPDRIRFHLKSDYESRKFYPFDFDLFISYNLAKNWVWVDYEVVNSSDSELFFSIGAHPGFSLPGFPETQYSLIFEQNETLQAFPLDHGLLHPKPASDLIVDGSNLQLDSETFKNDALVFNNVKSSWIGIRDESGNNLLKVHFSGFPWLGIWSKPAAPFICIEPWFGHADWIGKPSEISKKDGILHLEPEENFHCRFAVEVC
jgi:galactose mutarotase-like enzyme